jgi:hypothetical protein
MVNDIVDCYQRLYLDKKEIEIQTSLLCRGVEDLLLSQSISPGRRQKRNDDEVSEVEVSGALTRPLGSCA